MSRTNVSIQPASLSALPKMSLSGKKWILKSADIHAIQHLMHTLGISEVVARILAAKGFDEKDAREFLNPTLKSMLPDPLVLRDMDKAIKATFYALENSLPIAIFGDYDVDGATSSALLRRYFLSLGVSTLLYIPDRLQEGYGPNREAMHALKGQGVHLILMVDCGTLAFDVLEEAHHLGLQVIVLDHHLSEKNLPKAAAIINPNRQDEVLEKYSYLKKMCAAGVAFLFLVALNRFLREQNFFKEKTEPDLRQWMDLVALGTVCDIMPLSHLNRAFVYSGLKLMKTRSNPGIASLLDVSGIVGIPSSYHLGFMIGPRVNAGGRVGEANMGSILLTTHDEDIIREHSHRLNLLNQERQMLEKQMLEEVFEIIEHDGLNKRPVICVAHQNWHPGVIGIVASRIKERYNKPSLIASYMLDDAIGKGSGRSIPGADLGNAMHIAVKENLLLQGGGHTMAAGFAVHRDKFDAFYDFLCRRFEKSVREYIPSIELSGWLSLSSLNLMLVKDLSCLEPFGQDNPSPKFAVGPVTVCFSKTFGEGHVRLMVEDYFGNKMRAIHFRASGASYFNILVSGHTLFLVGALKHDTWGGKDEVTFTVEDVAI